MAFKDVYVDFETFMSKVLFEEEGAIRLLLLAVLENSKFLEEYRNRYFLPYPFQMSYVGKCVGEAEADGYIEKLKIGEADGIGSLLEQVKEDPDMELPIYSENLSHYSWDEWWGSRIQPFLDSSLSKEELDKLADHIIIIGSDRSSCWEYIPGKSQLVTLPNFTLFTITRKRKGVSAEQIAQEIAEISASGKVYDYVDPNLYLISPDHERIFIGDINEYCADEYGGDLEKTLNRILKEIQLGITTIYPFQWNEY